MVAFGELDPATRRWLALPWSKSPRARPGGKRSTRGGDGAPTGTVDEHRSGRSGRRDRGTADGARVRETPARQDRPDGLPLARLLDGSERLGEEPRGRLEVARAQQLQ